MASFLAGRMAQSLVLLVLVSIIGFAVLHLAPGGPMAQFALVPGMSQAQLAAMSHAMGLDQPLPVQYWQWFGRLLAGDWGRSYRDSVPVLAVIAARLPATLELMVAAVALAVVTGVAVGILGAVRRHSVFDALSTAGAMAALSIPTFWFGLVTIYVFSVKLGWLPSGNRSTPGDASPWGYVHHLIAPACVLALVEVAVWSRYMRSAMLDVIDQDFVRTARAKGLTERRVILHHVVRNALLPMITLAGLELPTLLGGALVTETVFTWPGMGRLFLDSLGYRDYPVVMGILMVSALLVLLGSLLADLLGAVADPRIRLG
ncbi:ABC transporter permease [Lichenibacterium minor]|uniref:ABC transporter permease n=1 Tax=Lichenibacterium minor TaxID=2316528 RepID=A0A4Q2U4M8_9HYPH|nr:ABC transporter permease [Lichenibacterium minor]RYC29931.1 ABC transporter permease [Lichenibacterium minor]